MNDLLEAQLIAKRCNVIILAKRTGIGHIQTYKVYRATSPKPTYLGERVSIPGLLIFVRQLATPQTLQP